MLHFDTVMLLHVFMHLMQLDVDNKEQNAFYHGFSSSCSHVVSCSS